MVQDLGGFAETMMSQMEDMQYFDPNSIISQVENNMEGVGRIFHEFLIRDTREPVLQSALGATMYAMKSMEVHLDLIPPVMDTLIQEFEESNDYDMREVAEMMKGIRGGKILIKNYRSD